MPGNADHQRQAVGQRLHESSAPGGAAQVRSAALARRSRVPLYPRAEISEREGLDRKRLAERPLLAFVEDLSEADLYCTTRTAGVIARSAAEVLSAINCDSKANMRLVLADPFSGTQ